MSIRSWIKDVASSLFFDNSTNGLVSDNVQDAIEEINQTVLTSASPGFSFGRSGNVSIGAYLQNETVPSNVSGRWVYISDAKVTRVFVSNENTTTYKMNVYSHDGNEVNLTLLGSVTVTAAKGGAFTVSWPVATNKQLAVRVAPDSPNSAKNVVCGLELSGTN